MFCVALLSFPLAEPHYLRYLQVPLFPRPAYHRVYPTHMTRHQSAVTMKTSLFTVAAVLCVRQALAQFATAAMMRFQCSQLVIERLDPLVNPGMLQSTHVHQIVGGNSFNATMTPVDYDPAEKSTCTTCSFSEDFSNYWTANMYFRAKNGSYKRVPQMVNLGLKGSQGVTVYYIPPYDGKTKVTAFKPV